MSAGHFGIIYADPPWSYDDPSLHRGGALRHYQTMSQADMCALPVGQLAAEDCALFMWGTWPKLAEALELMKSWGFTYKTCAFLWVKANRNFEVGQTLLLPEPEPDVFWGMGRWTRSNTEPCFLAVKGKPKRLAGDVHQVLYQPVGRHSAKPREVYGLIERLVGQLPRLELFCRQPEPGWEVFGNEVESTVRLCPP